MVDRYADAARSGTIAGVERLPADVTTALESLSTGDTLASSGAWTAALNAWSDAARLDPSMRPAVEQRLMWLLAEAGDRPAWFRSRQVALVALFALASIAATVFVLIAGTPGTPAANGWAVAAWVMILVASVAAVLAARAPAPEPYPQLVRRASRVAMRLDTSNHGDGNSDDV
jgi:hypothetical protein